MIHLSSCKTCQERRDFYSRASRLVAGYSNTLAVSEERPKGRREVLSRRLDTQLHDAVIVSSQRAGRANRFTSPLLGRYESLAIALGLTLVAAISIGIWHSQQAHRVSSNVFLLKAAVWDSGSGGTEGVIYQKVRITASRMLVERDIYRDMQGRRHARLQTLPYSDQQLRNRLDAVGVGWESPLSVAGYRDWYERQRDRQDRVKRVGPHLLALTTRVPNGPVMEQSLTVRESDFHPVQRVIVFRGSETVEIAELNYKILPWSDVNPDLFDPLQTTGGIRSDPVGLSNASSPLILPSPVNETQLDETELSVRLILNQLHADTGEQIEVTRDAPIVRVHGVVETRKRKRELEDQLLMLPHVTTSIASIEEMRERPSQASEITSMQVSSMEVHATPLETYYLEHGRSIDSLSKLSRRLFNSALTVDLESKALDDLEHRFSGRSNMSLLASATYADLIFTHRQNVLSALQSEKAMLADMGIQAALSEDRMQTPVESLSLVSVAEKNLALSKELALGNGDGRRPAEQIVTDLNASMKALYRGVLRTQSAALSPMNLNNKK